MELPESIYASRKLAVTNAGKFYTGKSCPKCQSTKRYLKGGGCVACVKDRHPNDSRRLHSRQWKLNNKEKVSAYRKQWHQTHKEEENQSNRARRLQYLTDDPNYDASKCRRFALHNRPSYLASKRVAASKRRAKKRAAEGTHSIKEWTVLKAKCGDLCLCCGALDSVEPLTEDHIIPLSAGGSNYITNIQPLCFQCNSKNFKRFRKFGTQTDYR